MYRPAKHVDAYQHYRIRSARNFIRIGFRVHARTRPIATRNQNNSRTDYAKH